MDPWMKWDSHFDKLLQMRQTAYNECRPLYADTYTPPSAKLTMFKSKEEATDKYAC